MFGNMAKGKLKIERGNRKLTEAQVGGQSQTHIVQTLWGTPKQNFSAIQKYIF
jgi:hypothetical protein